MKVLIDRLRRQRRSHLAVVNLRILLGFAFLPAGLKKVLGQPFTDPQNSGPFHDFLDAFLATGVFYQFVGVVQLIVAVLLMTQTFAPLGAVLALPVITVILVFCWSTGVVPTAVVVTLMFCGTLALVLWDMERWLPILQPADAALPDPSTDPAPPPSSLVDLGLWRLCGAGIVVFYGLSCLAAGGVYRPKGADWSHPAFYVLLLIALSPFATWWVERRRTGSALASSTESNRLPD